MVTSREKGGGEGACCQLCNAARTNDCKTPKLTLNSVFDILNMIPPGYPFFSASSQKAKEKYCNLLNPKFLDSKVPGARFYLFCLITAF